MASSRTEDGLLVQARAGRAAIGVMQLARIGQHAEAAQPE
jgi:hypothetical protein